MVGQAEEKRGGKTSALGIYGKEGRGEVAARKGQHQEIGGFEGGIIQVECLSGLEEGHHQYQHASGITDRN